jgi:hypothetical protein
MRLIDNAGKEFHRLWVIRASVGFAVFTALAGGIGWLAGTLNPFLLIALSVVFNIALIPLARLAKQEDQAAVGEVA